MSQNATTELSLMKLFELGAHRGNKKSKLNPKLKGKVYGTSKGLSLINLAETKNTIEDACALLHKLGQRNKQILIVGTAKHLQNLTEEFANSFSQPMPYVNKRWLGGSLTNWATVKNTLKTLGKLENIADNQEFFDKLSKKEQLSVIRQKEKANRVIGGMKNMKNNRVGAVIILDVGNNPIAVSEAELAKVPVIGLTNTNSIVLPKNLDYTIVCNNKSYNAVKGITDLFLSSYTAGLISNPQPEKAEKSEGGEERAPREERQPRQDRHHDRQDRGRERR